MHVLGDLTACMTSMLTSLSGKWICSEKIHTLMVRATESFGNTLIGVEDIVQSSTRTLRYLAVSGTPYPMGEYGRVMGMRQSRHRAEMVECLRQAHQDICELRQVPPPLLDYLGPIDLTVSTPSHSPTMKTSPSPPNSSNISNLSEKQIDRSKDVMHDVSSADTNTETVALSCNVEAGVTLATQIEVPPPVSSTLSQNPPFHFLRQANSSLDCPTAPPPSPELTRNYFQFPTSSEIINMPTLGPLPPLATLVEPRSTYAPIMTPPPVQFNDTNNRDAEMDVTRCAVSKPEVWSAEKNGDEKGKVYTTLR